MELARYAPEEVDKDEKKQDMFKKGLIPELRTLLTPQIYPDFNTLMNMAILTERAKADEKRDNKHKFMESKACQQDRIQKTRSFGNPVPRSQAPMQYRTQSQASGSYNPNAQFRSQNVNKTPQNSTSQVTNNNSNARACFNCRETRHYIANCPYASNKPVAPVRTRSVRGPVWSLLSDE